MDLEKVTLAIRPRSPWEAIDSGFMLARHWYGKLWLLWLLAAAPFFLLWVGCGFLLPGATTKWSLFLFWLLKPFYELPILNWVSKALFGEQGTVRGTLKDARKQLSLKRIITILLTRFSPFRLFSLPVLQLEGLEGKSRKSRLTLLVNNSETAVFLTAAGFCIELILTFSLMMVLFWLVPENLRWVNFGKLVSSSDNWILLTAYFLSCSIFAPLYTCSGFMMYISRRVELEAWDIEIGFKRMGQRLGRLKNGMVRTLAALILLLSIPLSILPNEARANAPAPKTAHETITRVLRNKDFGQKVTKYKWVAKEKDSPETTSAWTKLWAQALEVLARFFKKLVPVLAKYGEFLLWCCAGIITAFLLLKYSRLREWLDNRSGSRESAYAPPEIMFGMDIRPESLPEDIGASCLELLEKGRKRDTLSLLYRGTLSRLVNLHRLEIHPSFTEAECCHQVQDQRPEVEGTFFDDLTSLWVFLAYGHRNPNGEACHRLITQWNELYGVQP